MTGIGVAALPPVPSYDIRPVLEYLGATLPTHGGAWKKMRCPFHEDRNPSASVNYTANKFQCFSCGVHEDAIGLLQHAEGTDFKAAREEAERLSGEGSSRVRGKAGPRRTLFGE